MRHTIKFTAIGTDGSHYNLGDYTFETLFRKKEGDRIGELTFGMLSDGDTITSYWDYFVILRKDGTKQTVNYSWFE